MTFFGSRFLEKGRRSGSLFVVHSSMAHYRIQPGCRNTTVLRLGKAVNGQQNDAPGKSKSSERSQAEA
jgi:hypothetical protein